MSYHFENVRLEKGMYGRSGTSFTRTLEELDPSERYRGTPMEGLDAFQRQLKRFDIRVKGWCARDWRRGASCRTSPPR